MPTTGPINGTLLKVYRDTGSSTFVALGHATTNSFSASHSPRSITSQDSGGNDESLEGLRSYSISVSGFVADDATEGVAEYLDALISNSDRGAITWQYTTNVTGDRLISGDGWIESIEKSNGGPEETATFNISIKVTGAITATTVSV